MAQNLFEQLVSVQQLSNTLGYSLSQAEWQRCLELFQSSEPKVGKFWQGTDVDSGIYIVIASKVRLLDSAGELIATLEVDDSFGEFTLFPESKFQSYGARASVNFAAVLCSR